MVTGLEPVPLWLSITSLSVGMGLLVWFIAWLVRSDLRERRRQEAMQRFRDKYQQEPPALPAGREQPPREQNGDTAPKRRLTVDELVAKLQAEGLPTQLTWEKNDEPDQGPDDEDDWPTEVLPRIE